MKFERLPSKTGQSESGEELHAVNHGKRDAAETGLTASDSIESSGVRRFASAGREKRAMRPQLRSDSEICSFYDISGGHSTRQYRKALSMQSAADSRQMIYDFRRTHDCCAGFNIPIAYLYLFFFICRGKEGCPSRIDVVRMCNDVFISSIDKETASHWIVAVGVFPTHGRNRKRCFSINPEIIVPHNLNHEIVQKRD